MRKIFTDWPPRLVLSVVGVWLGLVACTPEDEVLTQEEDAQLVFSQDTVQFDTVFTTVGSTTQRLWVYNPQSNAVNISSIALGNTAGSPYRIAVNTDPGTQFQDVRLRGGDSLLVLVEVEIDPQDADLPFIIKDSIVFNTNGTVQDVNLEAWGQDAYFLKSTDITQDTTFTGERPYVICDSLRVLWPATLTLAAGTQLYFNDQASLLVGGTLRAEGTAEDRVQLQYVRRDGNYAQALGQWEGVLFGFGSQGNRLDFTNIRNAEVGVRIGSFDNDTVPDIIIANSMIEHMSEYGLFAVYTDVEVYNTVISDCALGGGLGLGRAYYRFRHCTLVNQDNSFIRSDDQPILTFIRNPFETEPEGITQMFSVLLYNNIIWGSLDRELSLAYFPSEDQFELLNTIIKTTDTTRLFEQTNLYNAQPLFADPTLFNYHLDSLSPAINAGLNLGIEEDIEGNPRDANPDVGAYEFVGQ